MMDRRCSEVGTSVKDSNSLVRTSTWYVPNDSRNGRISTPNSLASAYSIWKLRRALRTVPDSRRDLALQLWSKLHPDESAKATKPIADMEAYVNFLTRTARTGQLRTPPKVAFERRVEARRKRRLAWANLRSEARRQAYHDAHLEGMVRELQASKGVASNNGCARDE